jgi:hypothetical protein
MHARHEAGSCCTTAVVALHSSNKMCAVECVFESTMLVVGIIYAMAH